MAFQFNDREFTKFVNNFERRKGSVEWLDKKDLAGKSQEIVSSYATVLIKWDILARPVDPLINVKSMISIFEIKIDSISSRILRFYISIHTLSFLCPFK